MCNEYLNNSTIHLIFVLLSTGGDGGVCLLGRGVSVSESSVKGLSVKRVCMQGVSVWRRPSRRTCVQEGLCSGVCVRGVPKWRPPTSVASAASRYASYWKAFLFLFKFN